MSNVKDLLGHELEPYSMAVEKGKIKELAIAIGDDNPIPRVGKQKHLLCLP
ncbi:hypothetical protein [Peribacillus simplex]|uniref:hypothetical protein n=1 Tax=Peribacillus simplex TaxID=1478 RepID=UPI00162394EB|nr:hypothetical protein [Peribacillus simplex]